MQDKTYQRRIFALRRALDVANHKNQPDLGCLSVFVGIAIIILAVSISAGVSDWLFKRVNAKDCITACPAVVQVWPDHCVCSKGQASDSQWGAQ